MGDIIELSSRKGKVFQVWCCGECGGDKFHLPKPHGEAVCSKCWCTANRLVARLMEEPYGEEE